MLRASSDAIVMDGTDEVVSMDELTGSVRRA
jgi:hypothetical protein